MSKKIKITKPRLNQNNSRILLLLRLFFRYSAYCVFISIIIISLLNSFLLKQNMRSFVDKVEDRFFSNDYYRISSFDNLQTFFQSSIKGFSTNLNLTKIYISISEKNLQSIRLESELNRNENLRLKRPQHEAKLSVKNQIEENFIVNVRGKGDREFHFYDVNSMSLRINIQGNERLNGLDKFSIQRPILRNYSWEYLITEIVKSEGLLTVISKPIDFYLNGRYAGIYSMEEVPSSITLIRNNRPDGPIFSVDEKYGYHIDSTLDTYNLGKWKKSPIYNYSSKILYQSYSDALNGLKFSSNTFDFNEWAKYFALMDLFGTHHAVVPKSVKVYYNPELKKFQPILFDAHQGAGRLNSFILLDLIYENTLLTCEWICSYVEFFRGFLDNPDFIKNYLKYLEIYSSDQYIKQIQNTYQLNYKNLDGKFYSRFSRSDAIAAPGLSFYFFKFDKLLDRQKLIQKKLIIYSTLVNNNYKSN